MSAVFLLTSDIFSSDGWLCRTINVASDALWAYLLIGVLLACALWFTLRTKGVQFRMLGEMVRLLGDSGNKHDGKKHISSFQAFAVSVATRVGTGNLAGVATAIAIGGPGAVFWMWLIALLGSASAFVESTLAQLFKKKSKDSFIGGPAYYILQGLKMPWLSALFAILISITFGLSYNSIQSNTICSALDVAFGFNPVVVGIILTALSLLVVFGGIQRIAKVSSVIVPIMAIGYLFMALYVVLTHLSMVPSVFGIILKDAFGITQIAGGGIGATIMTGVKRGLFSNEAGEGSAPNVAATASTSHPVKQGLIQALGVFTDTLVVCSCTAFIILFSGIDTTSGLNGIALTQASLEAEIGPFGKYFIAIAILLFAYSSIIGNYYYGEVNIRFLTSMKRMKSNLASQRAELKEGMSEVADKNDELKGVISKDAGKIDEQKGVISREAGKIDELKSVISKDAGKIYELKEEISKDASLSREPDGGKGKVLLTIYRAFSGGIMVLFGALASLDLVWSIGDFFMALLTAVNLFALVLLCKYVFRLLDDYRTQKKAGIKDPVFHRTQLPDLDLDCWE